MGAGGCGLRALAERLNDLHLAPKDRGKVEEVIEKEKS
jgi:hypothetical protein